MKLPHKSLALGAAGVAAGVALGLTGLANAANPSPSPSPGSGQPDHRQGFMDRHGGPGDGMREMRGGYGGLVTAIDGNSITVNGPGGSETVTLNGSTTYYVGKTKASRSAISKGSIVMIRVADPSASRKVASVVSVVPAHLDGWVTKVDSDSITITDQDGFTRTITTSGSTTYQKDGAASTRSAVTVGAMVMAVGSVDDNGTTLDADQVFVGMPKLDGRGFRGRGRPMMGGPMMGGAPDAEQGSYPTA